MLGLNHQWPSKQWSLRKGKGLTDEMIDAMKANDVPDWY